MRRFYAEAAIEGGQVLLDGRPVRTPARAALALPTPALAEAVRTEWAAQGDRIDPATMPLTALANAAIDRVAPDPAAFAVGLARYGETDLLCYRAPEPPALVEAEAEAWDPLLDWARRRYDVHFELATGIVHRTQPAATVERLAAAVAALPPFALAALSPLVTIGGSLVAALAVDAGAIEPAAAFEACHLDELWQAARWGEDMLATEAREARRRDFLAAARLLSLL